MDSLCSVPAKCSLLANSEIAPDSTPVPADIAVNLEELADQRLSSIELGVFNIATSGERRSV